MRSNNLSSILRQPFDSRFPIEQAFITIQNVFDVDVKTIFKIYEIFNRWGFVVLEPLTSGDFSEELKSIKRLFGEVVSHNRADENGISLIKPIKGLPDYFGTTNVDTGLHTDGSFNETPPNIIILQSVIPSEEGGESQLLSSKLIFERLFQEDQSALSCLFKPNAFSIMRDNQSITRSVFRYVDEKVYTVFRANGTAKVFVPEKYYMSFQLMKSMASDPKNILKFKLKSHQMLVLDNTSVLHGRSAFPEGSNRTLNRVFLDGALPDSELLQFGFKPTQERTLVETV